MRKTAVTHLKGCLVVFALEANIPTYFSIYYIMFRFEIIQTYEKIYFNIPIYKTCMYIYMYIYSIYAYIYYMEVMFSRNISKINF